MRFAVFALIAGLAAGCGPSTAPPRGEPSDVTGKVTVMGKPAAALTIVFLPVEEGTLQAQFTLDKDGAFKGKMFPGEYTYLFEQGNAAGLYKSLPDAYKSANADHKVTVKAGQPVEVSAQ